MYILNKVKDRSALPFIQCIGRVLRKDKYGLKKNGLIMDGYVESDNKVSEVMLANKIIKYYLDFENMSLNLDDATKKIEEYLNIIKNINFEDSRVTKSAKMRIGKEEIEIQCNSIDWDNFGKYFDDVVQSKLHFAEYEKFLLLKRVKY